MGEQITLDLGLLQPEVGAWLDYNFGVCDSGLALIKTLSELGELADAHGRIFEGTKAGQDWRAKQRDGVGDVIIALLGYCHREGIDAAQAVAEAWAEVRQRDWKRYPKDGRTQ